MVVKTQAFNASRFDAKFLGSTGILKRSGPLQGTLQGGSIEEPSKGSHKESLKGSCWIPARSC